MSDWQPIETAPRDGTYVLLYNGEPMWAGCYECAAWFGEGETACWWSAGGPNGGLEVSYVKDGDLTHWMPLPEPPQP